MGQMAAPCQPMQLQCATTTAPTGETALAVSVTTRDSVAPVLPPPRAKVQATPLAPENDRETHLPTELPNTEPGIVEAFATLLRLLPEKPIAAGYAEHHLALTLRLDANLLARLEPHLREHTNYTPFQIPVVEVTESPLNAHILIVEDTLVSRLMLRRTLEKLPGCTITEASSGKEALDLLNQGLNPDLCISDISMPEMDGLTLLKHIRSTPNLSRLDVMLCTASNERDSILRAVELNVCRYLLKPFDPAEVKARVRETLIQSAARECRRIEELQQRVGLGPAATLEVLRSLSQQLTTDVSAVRNALVNNRHHGASMILQGLRGSCNSIQETEMVTRIDGLLEDLARGDLTGTLDGLELLLSEAKRISRMADKFSLILSARTVTQPPSR